MPVAGLPRAMSRIWVVIGGRVLVTALGGSAAGVVRCPPMTLMRSSTVEQSTHQRKATMMQRNKFTVKSGTMSRNYRDYASFMLETFITYEEEFEQMYAY